MKRFMGAFLATMLAAGASVSAFAASQDTIPLPAGSTMGGICGRDNTEAYASTYVNGSIDLTGFNNMKSTVEAIDYATGKSLGKRTVTERSQFTVARAVVTVPASKKISVNGAHQATINGKTYGFYTSCIGV